MAENKPFLMRVRDGKCPFCNHGDIFERNGAVLRLQAPKMHKYCNSCGHKFDEEPGFFYGAMYISYLLGALQMIAVFLTLYLPTKSFVVAFAGVTLVLILLSFFNFRISRIIWIQLFASKKGH